ncbi:YcaO-like family protein [Aurantiacibacter poecillastricola]|uniref:YcaO-like family protein n=1 Tax=Aurantiacibacter poecillastricola TaxID=3064385 RepID=UPI00273E863B|nr:YcaO-like family protein [Aurantiacibacter sp. 219JJ12-13]MDP5261351.1 YcaO-like family protein [Aurantiacibacter sp. 219JJ12-13]
MPLEPRARTLGDTLRAAVALCKCAGVTRVGDVTGFGVPGIPVFQAIRPWSRSLCVAQGKGLTPTAAAVSALLEAVELWSAENLRGSDPPVPLAKLPPADRALWTGDRHKLQIALDPLIERKWIQAKDLSSGDLRAVPFDLLSLDFTAGRLEYPATSNGLACGNTREEAIASGLAELLEQHCCAWFAALSPTERASCQVKLHTIEDALLEGLMARVRAAGFSLRAWSIGEAFGVSAFQCMLTENSRQFDDLAPSTGSACHTDKRVAFVGALLEAVQSRATLFAGARDDIVPDAYTGGREQEFAMMLASLGFGEGRRDWSAIPSRPAHDSEEVVRALLYVAGEITSLPVVAFRHELPCDDIELWHCLAPGLHDVARLDRAARKPPAAPAFPSIHASDRANRKFLFAGPGMHGLECPRNVELRPPAACGDLGALLAEPAATVALVDGVFRTSRTVWHREILSLLDAGWRVLGASSLGAIRAAELQRFGMEGVGEIFAGYACGAIARDDAVLLSHAPAYLGFAPFTVALVDAEYTLATLPIPPEDRRMMQRIVRTTDYTQRSWQSCCEQFECRTGRPFPVASEDLGRLPSLKRMDVLSLLEELAKPRGSRTRMSCSPPHTFYYDRLVTSLAPASVAAPT